MADGGWASVGWALKFLDLTADEVGALQSLFQGAEGRLSSFTFVDPGANLLCWSEDLTQAAWQKGPNLVLSEVQGAFAGTVGTQIANGSATVQSIAQTIAAPGTLVYCFSVYLRSDAPVPVSLMVNGEAVVTASVSGVWQRWEGASAVGTGSQAEFALSIPPGGIVQVCGLLAEAQPCAGVYKRTAEGGGVFPNSRFDQDSLDVTATGPGRFACDVRIVSKEIDG
jgi:hypothetical protein